MSLMYKIPADAILPIPPAIAGPRRAHQQWKRNTGRERTASPPEAKACCLPLRPRNDLEIAPPSPAIPAGGRNPSKRRKATILGMRVAQTRRATAVNYAAVLDDHLEQREEVDRDS